jgi:lysozyme
MITNLVDQLRRDEGEKLELYKDHLGYYTIGVGRLLDPRKGGRITAEESAYLLDNDVRSKTREVLRALPWAQHLDDARFGVLLNMAFQMGTEGLLKFKNTLANIRAGRYELAAEGMKQSLWHKQTPARCERLMEQVKTGRWQ